MRGLVHLHTGDALLNSMGYIIIALAIIAFGSLAVFMAVSLSELI
ncbi:hypothetical protein [Methanoculleus taiwanensis]|nr:hypothetical protein [Methanoculleus taiwanensis]